MGLFSKAKPEPKVAVQEDTTFIRYVIRKLGGARTDAEIDARITSLRASQAADTQRRLHDEQRVIEEAEVEACNRQKDHDLCVKHLEHLQVHFVPTAMHSTTRPQFVDVPEDFKVTCPECGKVVDVSKEVLKAAQRYEAAGPRIEAAIADGAFDMRGMVLDASIFKVNHYSVFDGRYCSTVIEICIKGCRQLGERRG